MKKSMLLVVAVAIVAAVFGMGTATQAAGVTAFPSLQQMVSDVAKSQKQMDFEEHLARKKAEFRRVTHEIKTENDEMRRKFDALEDMTSAK